MKNNSGKKPREYYLKKAFVRAIGKRTIDKNGCWISSGSRTTGGYVVIKCAGRRHQTLHRIIWEYKNGVIPAGLVVCHSCDVRTCFNPKHLLLGTKKENSEDMVKKGRSSFGEKNGFAKLTSEQVKKIRSLKGKMMQKEIAKIFGISQPHVSLLHSKKRIWSHI